MDKAEILIIGWCEWVRIPELGLPGIKAKVDTGAFTSSLHAFKMETFHDRGHLKVAFAVHPIQRRLDIVIECEALVIDHRSVSDSGGHRENRYVIEVPVYIGDRHWPIEITLANRETMSYRMLLGRSAMKNMIVDPHKSYLTGKPPGLLKAYKKRKL